MSSVVPLSADSGCLLCHCPQTVALVFSGQGSALSADSGTNGTAQAAIGSLNSATRHGPQGPAPQVQEAHPETCRPEDGSLFF